MHFTPVGHLCLIAWLIAGIFGIDTKASNTYQLFVFLSIVFIFALLGSVFNRFKGSIKRQLPRYATVGEPLTYHVSITNNSAKNYHNLAYGEQLATIFPDYSELLRYYQRQHKPWYKRGVSFRLWRRYLGWYRGAYIDEQTVPFLGIEQAERIKISCTPVRRGKLNFTGAIIAKPDLLGLFRRLYFAVEPQSCLALPKRYPVGVVCLKARRQYQAGGVSLANSVGDSAEFMALRDYRQGDSYNNIYWKSLARHGKLIVKEYQDEFFVRRALVLDTYAHELTHELFEAAVSVAASLAMSESHADALLDLMFVGQEAYRFTTGRGVDHLPRLQEVLAAVQASDAYAFKSLRLAVEQYSHQCSNLFCVLLQWDKERQDFIKSMQARGIPVAVFLVHEGQLNKEDLINQPECFYLIDVQHIADDLAAL